MIIKGKEDKWGTFLGEDGNFYSATGADGEITNISKEDGVLYTVAERNPDTGSVVAIKPI